MTKQEIRTAAYEKLREIIAAYIVQSTNKRWVNPTFAILQVEKGLRGEVGEDLVVELLTLAGYVDAVKNPGRSSRKQTKGAYDVSTNGLRIEVKTASEDVHGAFQFNSIKYDDNAPYDLLFLIGIAPNDILFRIYKKTEIPLGLPNMAKNTLGTHKFTHKHADLYDIKHFAKYAKQYLGERKK